MAVLRPVPSRREQEAEAALFFHTLYGFVPDDQRKTLWRLYDKSSWSFTDLDEAAAWAAGQRDIYTHAATTRTVFSGPRRLKAEDSDGLVAVWSDLDVVDPVHKKPGLPPSEDVALEIARATGLEPGVLVWSGHGLQAWWPFGEALEFETDDDRRQAARLVRAWDLSLRERARRMGYTLDAVGDLARLMRVPGTFNAKREPVVPVRLLEPRP